MFYFLSQTPPKIHCYTRHYYIISMSLLSKLWQYYQTYFILKGKDYEDKYALLSTPTKPAVGLITKTPALKPQQSPLRLHNAFMMGDSLCGGRATVSLILNPPNIVQTGV